MSRHFSKSSIRTEAVRGDYVRSSWYTSNVQVKTKDDESKCIDDVVDAVVGVAAI